MQKRKRAANLALPLVLSGHRLTVADPLAGSAHIGGEYLSWKDMVHKTFGKGHTTYAGRHRKKPSAKQLAEPALPHEKKKKPKKAEATADEEEAGGGPTGAAGEEGAEGGADEWKE